MRMIQNVSVLRFKAAVFFYNTASDSLFILRNYQLQLQHQQKVLSVGGYARRRLG